MAKIKITIEMELDDIMEEKEEPKTETKTVERDSGLCCSQYARYFDASSPMWTRNPETNYAFILQQEHYFNMLLKDRGYLFLSEVYEALGIPESEEFKNVGWLYGMKDVPSDGFVDFGLYSKLPGGVPCGYEKAVLLDFNVDGDISDYVKS